MITRIERLSQAVEIAAQWRRAKTPASSVELLAQHPDLVEFLAPLLGVDVGSASDGDAIEALTESATQIGRYRVVRELGRGGMGVVYEAIQLDLQRRVALKVLPAHLTLRPEAIARFRREALTAARLEHPGIVQIHEVGEQDGAHWFAMDLIAGQALDQVIEFARLDRGAEVSGAALPTRDAVRVIADVATALAFAHGSGIVHRDVKPSNIMLRPDGSPVLTDFGLAHEAGLPSLSDPGSLAGTLYYVSPEQVRGGAADARSDVFSLGVTTYELLTSRRPFAGDNTQEVLQQILRRDPTDPHRLNADLPADLCAIVLKAIEKEPARRYASATAFATDLRAFLAYRPVLARRSTRATRAWRWARREPLQAALSSAAIALLGLSAYAWWAQSQVSAHARQEDIENALAEGFLHYGQRDHEAAAAAFARVLALAPDHLDAKLAQVLVTNLQASAAKALQQLLDLGTVATTRAGRRLEAWLRHERGEFELANQISTELGEPTDALDAFLLAGIENDAGNVQPDQHRRVVERYETAMLLSPRPRAVFAFAWAQAVGWLRDQAATRRCLAVLAPWRDQWMAKMAAASALMHLDPQTAATEVRAVLQVMPDAAFVWGKLGSCLEIAGDNQGAAAAFAKSAELRPRVETFINLSIVRSRQGDDPGSAAAEDRALALAPEHPACVYVRGERALRRGELDVAIPLLERAGQWSGYPSRAHAFYSLGLARAGQGDAPGARAAYQQCLALRPFAMAMVNLANLLRREGDLVGAEQLHEQARAAEPDLMQAWHGLALCHADRERWQDLDALTARWLQEQGKMPQAWRWRAMWSRRSGASASSPEAAKDAVQSASRGVELSRRRAPEILFELGLAYDLAGDRDRALAVLDEAAVLAREPAMRGSAAAIDQALARIRGQAGR